MCLFTRLFRFYWVGPPPARSCSLFAIRLLERAISDYVSPPRPVNRKIIAPTISLNSGKIVYDYYLNLDGRRRRRYESSDDSWRGRRVSSSIRAHVDPTRGIILKWTDGVVGGGGGGGSCWVTECRVPLGTSRPGPLAADIRVGRRWVI